MKLIHNPALRCAGLTAACLFSTYASQAADEKPAEPKPTAWKTSAGLNVSVAQGNSDTVLIGAKINTIKKWDKNELEFGADATYGNNKDINTGVKSTTAQNYGAFGQYNRLVTERWYFGAHADGRQDRIAGITYRMTLAPSTGYYFIKNDKITLSGEAGPAVIFERLKNSATGTSSSSSYISLRFAEKFSWKINERATLLQDVEYLPRPDHFSDYVANGSVTLDTKIAGNLSSRITVQDFYRSEPAPGRKKNDLRILAGLNYTF
ncbi:MAG TPA: DUF481 domain-containing protein [Candidatus Limnocylindria bacterium]|jgi:putative salt-induced outer membrane protein YdiY|nr:DUF481 domain-containing protein [Candidatus Limnocylindria bacterium]